MVFVFINVTASSQTVVSCQRFMLKIWLDAFKWWNAISKKRISWNPVTSSDHLLKCPLIKRLWMFLNLSGTVGDMLRGVEVKSEQIRWRVILLSWDWPGVRSTTEAPQRRVCWATFVCSQRWRSPACQLTYGSEVLAPGRVVRKRSPKRWSR